MNFNVIDSFGEVIGEFDDFIEAKNFLDTSTKGQAVVRAEDKKVMAFRGHVRIKKERR